MWYWAETDVGMRRTLNEDCYFVKTILTKKGTLVGVYIVADGVGGANAGEVASYLSCKTAGFEILNNLKEMDEPNPESIEKLLTFAIKQANLKVWEFAQDNPSCQGMGSTIVACIQWGSTGIAANVGDSRLYVVNGGFSQVSKDHSLLQELLDRGELRPEQARTFTQKNVITRALGIGSDVEVSTYRLPTLASNANLLLCTDGLSGVVFDDDIIQNCQMVPSPQTICDTLISRANSLGGPDNITLIVVKPEATGRTEKPKFMPPKPKMLQPLKEIPIMPPTVAYPSVPSAPSSPVLAVAPAPLKASPTLQYGRMLRRKRIRKKKRISLAPLRKHKLILLTLIIATSLVATGFWVVCGLLVKQPPIPEKPSIEINIQSIANNSENYILQITDVTAGDRIGFSSLILKIFKSSLTQAMLSEDFVNLSHENYSRLHVYYNDTSPLKEVNKGDQIILDRKAFRTNYKLVIMDGNGEICNITLKQLLYPRPIEIDTINKNYSITMDALPNLTIDQIRLVIDEKGLNRTLSELKKNPTDNVSFKDGSYKENYLDLQDYIQLSKDVYDKCNFTIMDNYNYERLLIGLLGKGELPKPP